MNDIFNSDSGTSVRGYAGHRSPGDRRCAIDVDGRSIRMHNTGILRCIDNTLCDIPIHYLVRSTNNRMICKAGARVLRVADGGGRCEAEVQQPDLGHV